MALKRFNGNPEYYYDTVGDTHELTDNDIIPFTHKPGTEDDEDGKVKLSELKKYMNTTQDTTITAIQAKIPSDASSTNKLTSTNAVNTALAKYGKIYKDLESLNTDKGTAIELVNGEDNCSKIVEVLNANEVFSDYFNNSTSNSKWGIGSSSGTSYVLIRFEKLENNYCRISAYETDTNTEYFRVSKVGILGAWQINAKQTDLDGYMPTKRFDSPNSTTKYIKIVSIESFGGILLSFNYSSMYFISSESVLNLTNFDYGLTGVAISADKKTIWVRVSGWRMFTITSMSKSPYVTISDATTEAPSGYTFTTDWQRVATKNDLAVTMHRVFNGYSNNGQTLTFTLDPNSSSCYECRVYYYGGLLGVYSLVRDIFGANGAKINTVWTGAPAIYAITVDESSGVVSMSGTGADNVLFNIYKL